MTKVDRDKVIASLPTCRHCGQTINRETKPPRPEQQTAEAIRGLFGEWTHVQSFGGLVARECFIEHHQAFMNYVWFERVGDELVERPYAGDRVSDWMGFGIWPLRTEA